MIKFNTMLAECKKYKDDIVSIIETMGYIESMISVSAYRASLEYWCQPDFNKQAKTMVNQASQVNGSGFKDQVKNRQIESAKAIAQTQLAQGKAGSKEPMSKKDFIKWQDRVGVGHRNDDEAYKAYTNELDVAKSAKAALFAPPQQVFNEKDEPKNTKHSLDLSEDKLKEDLVKILDVSIETIEID